VEDWRPENPEEAVLSACSTLISVIDDKDGKIVQFSHFSVKEFLTSDRFRTSDIGNNFRYYVPLDDAHTILARACLTVLLQLDEKTDKKHLAKFPLAFYAAQHWVDHAKFGDVASRIQNGMERLFDPTKPYFRIWYWIHDVELEGKRTMNDLAEHPSRPEETPLYYAAFCGFIGLAKYLIVTHGEDVNADCGAWGSPLNATSDQGHADVARLLLDHGADVNSRNEYGFTPLGRAFGGGHIEVMRVLLEHGADVDSRTDNAFGTLLHDASYYGLAEIVHLLLQHNADVNAKGTREYVPLHLASRYGHTKVVRLLLEYGADVHVKDSFNDTPLDDATGKEHHGIVQLLLEHGAKDGRGAEKSTP
jgi:hypothetical protein